ESPGPGWQAERLDDVPIGVGEIAQHEERCVVQKRGRVGSQSGETKDVVQLAAMERPHGYRGVEAEGHERRRRRQKFPQARLDAPAGSDEPPAYRDEQVEVAKVIQEPEMNDEQLIHR